MRGGAVAAAALILVWTLSATPAAAQSGRIGRPVKPAAVEAPADVVGETSAAVALGVPSAIPLPVPIAGPSCSGGAHCDPGPCPPFYRIRPKGHKDEKKRIMLYNRLSEPDWYHYYRCQHYGYYPTQWAPWPEGWMLCRRPLPGPHPYDLKQPESKTPARPPGSSADRGSPARRPGPLEPPPPANR